MHIGIDFDNTIVCYDDVFHKAAVERNFIPATFSASKTEIRDFFRAQKQEAVWTELQGYVYGARMDLAQPFPGVGDFFEYCRKHNIRVSIISHKTKHPYLGIQYDLHTAAQKWLMKQPFFRDGINVFFELTLQEKLHRIERTGCDAFIDDLPELLNEPKFPQKPRKILFDPGNLYQENTQWQKLSSWEQMPSILSAFSNS